jgi:hypothetical protein
LKPFLEHLTKLNGSCAVLTGAGKVFILII